MNRYAHFECTDCSKSINAAERLAPVAKESVELFKEIQLNNFENGLGMLDEFLEGFELCDHTIHLDCIASILHYVLDCFDTIDVKDCGELTKADLRGYANTHREHARELEWILCHYDALTRAAVFPYQHAITRDCLLNAERIFAGLAFVQRALKGQKQISERDLIKLQQDGQTTAAQRVAIGELIRYLQRQRNFDSVKTLSAEELEQIVPEQIWQLD